MLDFLLKNISVKRIPKEWCELINVRIIDWDGWHNSDPTVPCSLVDFVERVSRCTIEEPKKERKATITFRPGDADNVVEIAIDDSGLTADEHNVLVGDDEEASEEASIPVFVGLAAGIHRLIRNTYKDYKTSGS